MTPEANLAGYIERLLLSGHSHPKLYDAEGLPTTIPAIASTLIGLLAYHLFQHVQQPIARCKALSLIGIFFPLNKALWTSSYILWTRGIALLLLMLIFPEHPAALIYAGIYILIWMLATFSINFIKKKRIMKNAHSDDELDLDTANISSQEEIEDEDPEVIEAIFPMSM